VELRQPDHVVEFQAVVRAFLAEKSPEEIVRRDAQSELGYDRGLWRQLADLGVLALTIPEEFGGAGYGPVEQAAVLEEMGRRLLCAPYLSTAVLAVAALRSSGDLAMQYELLPKIATGEAIVAVALDDGPTLTAHRSGDGDWTLDGARSFVLDGCAAGYLIAAAPADDGRLGVFVIDCADVGVERSALPTMDLTRRQAHVVLRHVPAVLISELGDGGRILDEVRSAAVTALAAEQVGGAEHLVQLSVEYAKQRVQFGKPIASYQAIKHKCADMAVEVERARAAATFAAHAASDGDGEYRLLAHVAKVVCSEAYFYVAADAIQVHGGIGFTWEHPAHLYFKRAKSSELMFGDPQEYRSLVGDAVGI
jgi:alkylation response protein AidB-like acyl-CoA dehydrogenase